MENLKIGTCSWKYPTWYPELYSAPKGINYLAEYSARYDTVEIDQWFWSLFGPTDVVLPKNETVTEYASSVPENFRFSVKAPNSITLTHLYTRYTKGKLFPNEHFLSVRLLEAFLETLEPMRPKLGPIMFQFEYLNRTKMASMKQFIDRLGDFFGKAPKGYSYALEPRNPQLFDRPYFSFLKDHALSHVFIQGYYMPEITTIYSPWSSYIDREAIIRLHGYDRLGIEEKTKKKYDRIVVPMDDELPSVIEMIQDMRSRGVSVYLNVNNHYEGSAPLSIGKIVESLDDRD